MSEACPPDIRGNVVFRKIWRNVHEERGNQIILINGLPRRGKSELALDLAYHLYRGPAPDYEHRFDVKKHCKWDKVSVQEMVRSTKDVGFTPMWDEAGIAELGAHARQFWSESNIALSTLFQIMGFRRQIALITLPMKIMLDKHLRMLSHVNIDAVRVSPRKKRCYAKLWWVELAGQSKNPYVKYPRFVGDDGLRYRMKMIAVPRAPVEVRRDYVAYSETFKDWLERRLISTAVSGKKTKKKRTAATLKKTYEKIKSDPSNYLKADGSGLDVSALVMLEDLSQSSAGLLKRWWDRQEGSS